MLTPIRRIGASKLATVSECQTAQGTHVALKQFDRQTLSSFHHERIFSAAQRWMGVKDACLVAYHNVIPADNQIVMDLLDRSAAVRLTEGHSDPRLVLHTLRDILTALSFLHEQGLLHCNLKPTNVFFGADGRARLSDGMLVPAHAPGTLPPPSNQKYLSPEHTSDTCGPMSPATDLYTAGFLALELLAGDRFGRAFQGIGDDANDEDLAWFQWHGSSQVAPSATAFAKTCPPELVNAIARLVAKHPADRFVSARQALQSLPQDISIEFRTPDKVAAENVQVKREALASHVMERPATGIVLAVASGARAGEMIGTNDSEFFIGFDHDCFVRFSLDQYPDINAKLLVRRGRDGWTVVRVRGDSTFINQRLLEEKATLRSGDMLRLSSRGPDVQFTMQSGGVAIRSLVNRFLPEHSKGPQRPPIPGQTSKPSSPHAKPMQAVSNPGVANAGGAHRTQGGQGESPATMPRTDARPTAPGPKPGSRAAAPPRSTTQGPQKPPTPKTTGQTRPDGASATNAGKGKGGLSFKNMSKNQKNAAIAIVGGILVIILVIFFPTGSAPKKSNENTIEDPTKSANPETRPAENAAEDSSESESLENESESDRQGDST